MKRIFRRSEPTRDVRDELRFHLEMRAHEFMDAGGSPKPRLASAATRAFGDVAAIDAELSVARLAHVNSRERRESLREFARDVTFAVRTLRKNRGFTLAALATLALGIGAATAVFTVVDGVLLRPLPYGDPSRLAMIWLARNANLGDRSAAVQWILQRRRDDRPTILLFDRRVSFLAVHAHRLDGDPEQISGARVTPSLFGVLGVRPMLGHDFVVADAESGAAPVAIISHALWATSLRRRPEVVGRSIELGGESVQHHRRHAARLRVSTRRRVADAVCSSDLRTDIWIPLPFVGEGSHRLRNDEHVGDRALAPGVTLGRAHGELSVPLQQIPEGERAEARLDYNLVDAQGAGRRPRPPRTLSADGRGRVPPVHRMRERREPARRSHGERAGASSPCARRSAPAVRGSRGS